MNGYQKAKYLEQFAQPKRGLIDLTAYEMMEGEADIESAFDWAQSELGHIVGMDTVLTDEIRNAVMHIVNNMK